MLTDMSGKLLINELSDLSVLASLGKGDKDQDTFAPPHNMINGPLSGHFAFPFGDNTGSTEPEEKEVKGRVGPQRIFGRNLSRRGTRAFYVR